MEDYIAALPDIFFTGSDGSMRSNRVLCQLAGLYAADLFVGSTLQMDGDANSSTVTAGRLAGFGGAPNMGCDPHGRRHTSPPTAKRLEVSVPSHCALLKPVADELTRCMSKIEMKTPNAIYVSNRRARALRDPEGIREDLATNVQYAVLCYDAVTVAYERGIRLFIELPPGRTLTDLVTAAFPDARSVAFEQMRIDSLVKLIKRFAASTEL